ncbi:unnamed protein product [Lampetra fluviatilis]
MESGTPETGPEEAIPPEQSAGDANSAPLLTRGRWSARKTCLTNLLTAVAVLIAQLDMEKPEEETAVQVPQAGSSTTATSQAREAAELQPAQMTAILSVAWQSLHAKVSVLLISLPEAPSLKKQLPFVQEFVAEGGNWAAFQCRFTTT